MRWYHVYQDLRKPLIGEKLVAKREFNNPMDKHAMKVVKGDETVSHLPCTFSWIAWYFLACGGEIIGVKEIGRRRCGGMEVLCQSKFKCSIKEQIKLLKELLAFRTVLKIVTNGSFESHRKQWSTTGFIVFNLYLLKAFSSICDTKSQFTLSESNGLVYKPHPRFLAQNLSKKVRLIHESLRYIVNYLPPMLTCSLP